MAAATPYDRTKDQHLRAINQTFKQAVRSRIEDKCCKGDSSCGAAQECLDVQNCDDSLTGEVLIDGSASILFVKL